MSVVRACLFDMDGVLIHSSDIHRRAFARALLDENVALPEYAEIAGMRTDAALDHIFARCGRVLDPARRRSLVRSKRALALRMLEDERPVVEGCVEVLGALHDRGRRLALASSASAASVETFLRVSGTASLFSAVVSGEEVTRGKPDPEIFLTAAARLGVPADECIVIEDSRSGVAAGRRSGARVIGIAGETSADELVESGADHVIHSLRELVDLGFEGE